MKLATNDDIMVNMLEIQIKQLKEKLSQYALGRKVNEFLGYLHVEAGLSPNSILAYGRDLLMFVEYCDPDNVRSLADIRPVTAYGFIQSLGRQGKAESTISRGLVAVKMLIRFGLLTGAITEDITDTLEAPKQWKRLPSVISRDQVFKLLAAPDVELDPFYLRDVAILETLYATGARVSEVANLSAKDINFDFGYVRCFGKGNKERIVPLGTQANKTIKRYMSELRPLLLRDHSPTTLFLTNNGHAIDRTNLWRIVKKYALRAGLPKTMTVHTIRHCFETHLLYGGVDLRYLQEMLGHADDSTTQVYTHVDNDRLREIHKKYHPRA